MTREEQIKQASLNNDNYILATKRVDCISFQDGARWAYAHPIISKELLEKLIKDIETGEVKTVSQYSCNPELSKAYDDGYIFALKSLLQWINFNNKEDK